MLIIHLNYITSTIIAIGLTGAMQNKVSINDKNSVKSYKSCKRRLPRTTGAMDKMMFKPSFYARPMDANG